MKSLTHTPVNKTIAIAVLLCAGAMLSLSATDLFACSCVWGRPFMVVARSADVIVQAKILNYNQKIHDGLYSSMDIQVNDVLKGTLKTKRIRVLGDNGALCRPYVNTFPINTEWVLSLKRDGAEDYSMMGCGSYWLRVKDGAVVGKITNQRRELPEQKMSIPLFKPRLEEILSSSLPEVLIRLAGPAGQPEVTGIGVETHPQVLASPAPPYAEDAARNKIEGIVVLQAIIRKDGAVDSVNAIGTLGYGLDESAINTIAGKWRFKPAKIADKPVDVKATIRYSFRLISPLLATIVKSSMVGVARDGRLKDSGYGNLKENEFVRGFTYTSPCMGGYDTKEYPAAWITPQSLLEIRIFEPISGQAELCNLQVTMKDFIYGLNGSSLITMPPGPPERKR
jgi:TonB family protein